MAVGARAGDCVHASAVELPAATTTVTPAVVRLATELSSGVEMPPPRLMLTTIGRDGLACFCCSTQSRPAITPDDEPEPEQSSTRTPTSETPFATPYFVPPTVPETCVPWPLQSTAVPFGVTAS